MLQRKTPLKAKTPLRAKTGLKTNTTLKAKQSFRDSYAKKITEGTKEAYKPKVNPSKKKNTAKPYKPKYPYKSIFTDDLTKCYITGSTKDTADIHVHHIFSGPLKQHSEKYHFMIPLRSDWHDMADYGIHFNRELDLKIKRICQEYWLEHYGTKEEFIAVFGQWW